MPKKIKTGIKYNAVHEHMEKDGKYYLPELDQMRGEIILRDNTKQFLRKKALAESITKRIKSGLDPEKVLMEALMKIPEKDLKNLARESRKKKAKPRTRANRCVDMTVGNFIIPIIV